MSDAIVDKHTPGPWIVDGDGFVYDANGTRKQPICDPRCFDSTSADAMAEMDANANLIAAAPDLLAALQAIHSALYALRGKAENNAAAIRAVDKVTVKEWREMESKVRAAIARATT